MHERHPDSPPALRYDVIPQDRESVRSLVAATGFFAPYEVNVAVELVEERLAKGPASGYHFVFAEQQKQLLGYACYGPIACTQSSFDLYWIAVDVRSQRRGLGRRLLTEAESQIRRASGRRVYIETSNRLQYASTRVFYERCGYRCEAVLKDFYAPGDDKVIYSRALTTDA